MNSVTNAQILKAVGGINKRLDTLNATVKKNCIDIAVLKEKEEHSSTRWGYVINLLLGIVQAASIWMILGR